MREAERAQVLALNHDLDPRSRDTALKEWSAKEFPQEHEAKWFELTSAASAGLTIIALLTLACESSCDETDIARIYGTYFPWTSALAAMLDSYVDQDEDAENGNHIYIAHYATPEQATQHICRLASRSLCEASTLKNADKHVLIAACMLAMYLSKDSARSPEFRNETKRMVAAGGSLTRALLPVLRLWRVAYSQCSE